MTIASATNRMDYVGNNTTDTYSYTFKIFSKNDLRVTKKNTSNVETLLVVDTDYTVTGVGSLSGGTIVLTAGTLATGHTLTIRRVRSLVQETDIRNQGDFFPEAIENAFDHLVMLAQQHQDEIDRSIKNPESVSSSAFSPTLPTTITSGGGRALKINDAGTGFELGPTATQVAQYQDAINSAPPWFNALDYQDGTRTDETIIAAMAAIEADLGSGARYGLLIKRGTWTINANVTIPSNVHLIIENGAVLSVATSTTLTINGQFTCPISQAFSLTGSGAVVFSAGYIQEYYIEWFGGGAGVSAATNTTAFNNLKTSMTSGIIRLLGGTYAFNDEISVKDKVRVFGLGKKTTLLDFSSASGSFSNGACLYGTGSIGSALPGFTTSLSLGDNTIDFTSSPSLSVGDTIILYNSADSSWNSARTYYRSGEFNKVKSMATNTATLTRPVYDAYASGGTVSVYKVTPIATSLGNFSIKVKSGQTGILIKLGELVSVSDIEVWNTDISHVTLSQCYKYVVSNITCVWPSVDVGYNYGVTIGNSQSGVVSNCNLETTRHSLTFGGGDFVGCVPNRECIVTNNILNTCTTASTVLSADLHGNCEFITFYNNQILGGINLGGDNIQILGGTLRQPKDGYLCYTSELRGLNITIMNVVMDYFDATSSSSLGVLDFGGNGTMGEIKVDSRFVFKDNVIRGNTTLLTNSTLYFYLFTRAASQQLHVEISGNKFMTPGLSGSGQNGITVRNASGNYINSLTIKDNSLVNGIINVKDVNTEYLELTNNDCLKAPDYGIQVSENASPNFTTNFWNISGNKVKKSRLGGITIGGKATNTTTLICEGNTSINNAQTTTGSSSTDSSIFISNISDCFFHNNICGDNQGSPTQQRVWAFSGITNLYEGINFNIKRDSLSATTYSSVTNELGYFTYKASNVVRYSAAAPASGAWKAGDRYYDDSPSAAGKIGGVCVTAGSPGTWKDFGAIDA